ncbi:MAG: FprA family A-type flavoprotein [Muribaculaceae bacterium]|nr:FprA family A-type flavoprotein [Muribaculaceae bacterium]
MTHAISKVAPDIYYIGVDDHTIDLFESQYPVPDGISYNSYVVKSDKIAVVDTTDNRTADEWLDNLRSVLDGKTPDYLVIEHLEPDHSSLIQTFAELYPESKLVMTAKAATMLPNYLEPMLPQERIIQVKEGDTLDLGQVTMQFYMTPMVHWPEVMMIYVPEEKLLFSADAFGTFATYGTPAAEWKKEARRYYINIVGKYGTQVQAALKKLSGLDITTICPLHGPVLRENIADALASYDIWSSYKEEKDGIFIACASIHGNTLEAARYLAEALGKSGVEKVHLTDLTREPVSVAVADAFRYPKAIFCASSYDAGLFTPMHTFLHTLSIKGYSNKKVALVENGSWAPTAGKVMRSMLEGMKNVEILPDIVTVKGKFKTADRDAMLEFARKVIEM